MGIFLLGSALTAFNGGKSQTGTSLVGLSNDYPFINVMKGAQNWANIGGGGSSAMDPRNFDADGYPTSLPGASSSGITALTYIPTQAQRSGRWAITWTNTQPATTSTIFTSGFTANSPTGSKSTTAATGRYEFLPGATDHGISIGCVTANISNLQVFHVNDEADLLAGNVFTRDFKNLITAAKIGWLRNGDWLNMNTSLITTWESRKPTTYVWYGYPEMRSSITAGATNPSGTDTGDNYTINFNDPIYGNGAPVDKQTIILSFDRDSVGTTPTLNLNGTGAVSIAMPFGTSMSGFTNRRPLSGRWGTVIYDADLNVWMLNGGNGQQNNFYLDNGVPPELIVRLCQEVGAHPHFTAPRLSLLPVTNWHTSLATYCRSYGPSWMIPVFETPNETFNSASGFYNNAYGKAKQLALYGQKPYDAAVTYPVTSVTWTGAGSTGSSVLKITGTLPPLGARVNNSASGWTGANGFGSVNCYVVARDTLNNTVTVNAAPTSGTSPITGLTTASIVPDASDHQNFTGTCASNLGQQINAVYGGAVDGTKYKVVVGLQTGALDTVNNRANQYPRLASPYCAISQGTNNSPDLTKCAFNWVTDVCCAQYIQPSDYVKNAEVIKAYRYAGGDLTALDDYCDTLASGTGTFTLAATAILYQNAVTFATSNWGNSCFLPGSGSKNFGVRGYEGGWSPDFLLVDTVSPVSGATQDASGMVITLATTTITGGTAQSGPALDATSINIARLTLASFGGMTQANGLTGTVIGVGVASGLTANQVRLNIDSSGFSAYTSGGTATYVGPTTSTTIGNAVTSQVLINTLRNDAMFSTRLQVHTATNYANFVSAGGVAPSQYTFAGPSTNAGGTSAVGTGSVWGLFRPSIYSTPHSTAYEAIVAFNA